MDEIVIAKLYQFLKEWAALTNSIHNAKRATPTNAPPPWKFQTFFTFLNYKWTIEEYGF